MRAKQKLSGNNTRPIHVVLEHLSGPSIGLETRFSSDQIEINLNPDKLLSVNKTSQPDDFKVASTSITRFARTGGTYRLESLHNFPIWVNGRQVTSGELLDTDIIEFGENGVLSG